ncbi:MAG TPA: hypothetical protein VFW33_17415 [Gemmataceae bacterium]|nr:hypothetical protein [Gemmataceae bacterium]
MKLTTCVPWLVLLLIPAPLAAQTAAPPDPAATADLARLIHKLIVARLPPAYENAADWGQTVPLPERLRAPRLRRTVVQVGDHVEVPDGTWRKLRLRVEDPDRAIRVRVPSFQRVAPMRYRVVVEVDAAVRGEADVRQWRLGLELADLTARADVVLAVRAECEVAARLVPGKGLLLDPELTDLRLTLREFTPKEVTFRRAGVTLRGGAVESAGEDLRDSLQALLRAAEPGVRGRANDALARALKDGKDPLPMAELLKAVAPLLGRE